MKQFWNLLREAVTSWIGDNAPSMGAALAFYTLFSIAPVMLIVVSVAGLVFGEQAARAEVVQQMSTLVGPQSAETAESLLKSLDRPDAGIIGTIVGVVALLVGATTVFAELQNALDRVGKRRPARNPADCCSC